MSAPADVTLRSFEEVRDAFRAKDLKQALYDEGGVVMSDVLLTCTAMPPCPAPAGEPAVPPGHLPPLRDGSSRPRSYQSTLDPFLAAREVDLVALGYRVIMNLTALIAGIDRPAGTPEETEALLEFTKLFSVGATLVHSDPRPRHRPGRDHRRPRALRRRGSSGPRSSAAAASSTATVPATSPRRSCHPTC